MHRVLITGGDGQLATTIMSLVSNTKSHFTPLSHQKADICDSEAMERILLELGIDTIVNCAAYTRVEDAESSVEDAMRINRDGVATLADLCTKHNIRLIHLSTDYVFGAEMERTTPYTEEDVPRPINIYGRSKAEGEREALRAPRAIVLRVSWLYSPYGNNFCLKIRQLGATRNELSVVNDQWGTPTSALGLARLIIEIIDGGLGERMEGIYNYSDGGACTWYDFACEIIRLDGSQCTIRGCTSQEYPTRAARPRYSVLDKGRITEVTGREPIAWQTMLGECMEIIGKNDEA